MFESLITIAGAGIIASTIYYSVKIMKDNESSRLAENVIMEIREIEKQEYENKKTMAESLFDILEWYAFLVNTSKIRNERKFFEEELIKWYKEIFLNADCIEDSRLYPEFKRLIKKITDKKYQDS